MSENSQVSQSPPTITDPVDLAKAVAGLTLQEAVNLGEINPAMMRRFGERMEQLWKALVMGAGVQWGTEGDLQIVWPVVENPILKAARERKESRLKEVSDRLTDSTLIPPDTIMASDG